MIEVRITGLDQIQQLVDPVAFERVLDKAVDRAAEAVRDETKKLPPVSAARTGWEAKGIPVDTGRMRQSVQKRKLALLAAEVYTNAHYGPYVHWGTDKMPPRPFFRWLVEDFNGLARIEQLVQHTLDSHFRPLNGK